MLIIGKRTCMCKIRNNFGHLNLGFLVVIVFIINAINLQGLMFRGNRATVINLLLTFQEPKESFDINLKSN